MSKIVPCLWFDHEAEDAANYYVSIFKDSEIVDVSHYGEGAPLPAGTVLTATFRIQGQEFIALNGGPVDWKFNESLSFLVNCADQAEVDEYWERLTADGGAEVQCGWLKDKYGVSWQIIPTRLNELLADEDPAKAQRVMQAMLKMIKIDVAELEKAAQEA